MVPFEFLERVDEGHYRLASEAARLAAATTEEAAVAVPVIEESLEVGKRVVETGRVRIRKVIREEEETLDEPLNREEVTVERVAVNRLVEKAPDARQEGEDWVIPVVEEVLVVEKRLMLREELHVRKRVVEERRPQQVTLRREEVVIERLAARGAPGDSGAADGARPPGSAASSGGDGGSDGTTVAPR
jgi:uncharacterized protein (TIGR02271 family)